jgi:translation initiation factor 6
MVFCGTFEAELADVIPVVKTSIAGTQIIGRLCAGENSEVLFCLVLESAMQCFVL